MKATEPIRNKLQVRQLAEYYLKRGEIRNYVLVIMSVHTALRISDLLHIRWDDVYDFEKKHVRESISITEKKTRKTKMIALHPQIKAALHLYAPAAKSGAFLIDNQRTGKSISRIQAYRLIRSAAEALEFLHQVSCHSLRKTFGYHAWKNGVSPAIIMDIYNHSSLAVTKRYLGITQDDKNAVYMSLDFS
ncbi:MAG: tyrosine-type recombinase/integrase [Oscillospiraceae bacterium]|nr:tyrosine-type recombinase/integrase [Oscillospiraceae bacterium]